MITVGPSLVELSHTIIDDLITDLHYSYMIYSAIRNGNIPNKLAHLLIVLVSHSRWLTTTFRFSRILLGHHNLKGFELKRTTIYCSTYSGCVLAELVLYKYQFIAFRVSETCSSSDRTFENLTKKIRADCGADCANIFLMCPSRSSFAYNVVQ